MNTSNRTYATSPKATAVAVDHWPSVFAMIEADLGPRSEIVTRYGMIALSGGLLYLYSGDPLMLAWIAAYFVLNRIYCWTLGATTAPVAIGRYSLLLALNIASTCVFVSLPLYVWTFDDLGFKALAVAGVAGHAMFNLARHNKPNFASVWETLSVSGSILFMGVYHFLSIENTNQQTLTAVATIIILAYYLMTRAQTIRLHQDLQVARSDVLQAQKMQAVGQLTSGVAHDFNNLLTAIRGNVEIAEMTTDPREREASLHEAREAADRAAALTSQLLNFSRKARLRSEVIALEPFLTNLDEMMRHFLPDTMDLSVGRDAGASQVYCDRNQLENALVNLALNARDATGGTGRMQIHFSEVDRPMPFALSGQTLPKGAYTRIEVRDDGPGIPEELKAQVLEPFFTTKAPGKGSGLGLSSVKGFVEQSNGGIALRAGNPGTLVTLLLPKTPG